MSRRPKGQRLVVSDGGVVDVCVGEQRVVVYCDDRDGECSHMVYTADEIESLVKLLTYAKERICLSSGLIPG